MLFYFFLVALSFFLILGFWIFSQPQKEKGKIYLIPIGLQLFGRMADRSVFKNHPQSSVDSAQAPFPGNRMS